MIELLSPAGSPEAVIAAVQNGADAVYMGMGNFNARRGAKNFTDEEYERAVRYCHVRGCKVYVTLNTLINDREVEPALQAARLASEVGTDGIIIQDLGLIAAVRQYLPDIPLHASTQMSIHNLPGVEAAAELGMTRAVLARELSLDQIRFITQNAPIETEIFVRDGDLRPRGAVLLPLGPVLHVGPHRAEKRQPRHVRPALPPPVFSRRAHG